MVSEETGSTLRFPIQKTTQEIKDRLETKIVQLTAKVKEREERVATLRKEYDIDDAALVQLLTAARRASERRESAMNFSYSSPMSNKQVRQSGSGPEERTIGAGVVNNLLTENDFIESERDSIKNLQLMGRNLRPQMAVSSTGVAYSQDWFSLNTHELEYLGF